MKTAYTRTVFIKRFSLKFFFSIVNSVVHTGKIAEKTIVRENV